MKKKLILFILILLIPAFAWASSRIVFMSPGVGQDATCPCSDGTTTSDSRTVDICEDFDSGAFRNAATADTLDDETYPANVGTCGNNNMFQDGTDGGPGNAYWNYASDDHIFRITFRATERQDFQYFVQMMGVTNVSWSIQDRDNGSFRFNWCDNGETDRSVDVAIALDTWTTWEVQWDGSNSNANSVRLWVDNSEEDLGVNDTTTDDANRTPANLRIRGSDGGIMQIEYFILDDGAPTTRIPDPCD